MYSEKLMELATNPLNAGSMDEEATDVGTGVVGSPTCGDIMKLQIQVDADGRITDAKFKTFGCGAAIASASLATEWLKGKTLQEAVEIKNVAIAKELDLPPLKVHCSVLAEDVIQSAIDDWKKKNGLE
jgi:nitrogen fixation protein NifU and related proteins